MASYKGHEAFNVVMFTPFVFVIPKDYLIYFGTGYFLGTFLLSPDIDLSHSKPSQRLKFLKAIWFPFWFFSKHRGITHKPFLGTFVKLFYLIFISLFLFFVILGILSLLDVKTEIYKLNPFEFLENLIRRTETLYFVGGLLLADLFHITLDWITSKVRIK
ncbi:metal-binding protein [Aquifex pyrophilus]